MASRPSTGKKRGAHLLHVTAVNTWPRRPSIDAWRFFFFPICFRLGPRVALVIKVSTSARYSNLVVLFTRSSGFNSAPVTVRSYVIKFMDYLGEF